MLFFNFYKGFIFTQLSYNFVELIFKVLTSYLVNSYFITGIDMYHMLLFSNLMQNCH